MRLAAIAFSFAVAAACRGGQPAGEPASTTQAAPPRLQVVYDIDVDKAIDDRHASIRRDLEVALGDKKIRATVRLTPEGLRVTPEDPAKKPDIEALLTADYADSIEMRTCGADICLHTSPSMSAAIRKAALENAVRIIQERFDTMKLDAPRVSPRGEQIVVDLARKDERAKQVIARTGALEFKVVDTSSDFMKGVYAISSEDPRARELGLQGEIDRWQEVSGGSTSIDYYFLATDTAARTGRKAIETYFAEIAVRDPRYKVPDDREIVYQRIESPDKHSSWRSYLVERKAELTGRDIQNAMGAYDPNTNRPVVLLDFTRAGAQALADVTARNVGRKLATILDGTVRSAPIINGTIAGGKVSVAMGGYDLTAQEAERDDLVSVLKTGSLPAPLREAR